MVRSGRARIAAIVAAALVVVVAVGFAVLSSRSTPDAAAAGETTASATAPTPAADETTTAAPTPTPSPTPADSPVAVATPDAETAAPAAEGEAVAVLDPVPLESPAEYGNGVTASLHSIERSTAEAVGPGEVSGDALVVSVDIVNGTDAALNLDAVVVDMSGPDGAPAPQYYGDSRNVPFGGSLAPGDTATGVFVIKLPSTDGDVTVTVSYDAAVPAVSFTGKA